MKDILTAIHRLHD